MVLIHTLYVNNSKREYTNTIMFCYCFTFYTTLLLWCYWKTKINISRTEIHTNGQAGCRVDTRLPSTLHYFIFIMVALIYYYINYSIINLRHLLAIPRVFSTFFWPPNLLSRKIHLFDGSLRFLNCMCFVSNLKEDS